MENRALYQNNFDYCVAIHRVPKGSSSGSKLNFEKATAELKTMGIELLQLVPFKNQRELGQIYTDIHTAKDAKDRAPETLFSQGIDLFHARVLHDANCVSYLMSTGGSNPHSSKTVFVTCDFYLARIRKARPDQYEFITTAPEFYEFMLPYLFAADAIAAQPVETPNFLLAAAISAEMQKGVDLRSLFGLALQEGKPDDVRNYEILSGLQNDRRFGSIKAKWLEVKTTQSTEVLEERIADVQQGFLDYVGSVRESLETDLYSAERNELHGRLTEAQTANRALRRELDRLKKKQQGRERHLRRMTRGTRDR